jgi:hypothetical protein
MENIVDRAVVEEWDGDGRCEVQASLNEASGEYGVRLAGYRENGRFAQYPPHVPPDEETIERTVEAIERMAESARAANRQQDLGEIHDLAEEVGFERAREALEAVAAEDRDEQR